MDNSSKTQLAIIGSGPGGYNAAFRAADLGLDVTLIDKNNSLGGVCLNRGCIPSKSLLHISKIINEAKHSSKIGVKFSEPEINLDKIHKWKNKIINDLNKGIESLAKARKVNLINGTAKFLSANQLSITDNQEKNIKLEFDNCIIASGSKSSVIPVLDKSHPSILYSKDALNFNKIPKRLLVIGGGYIGLEMGSIYHSLGSEVTVIEYLPNLLPGADPDLVKPLEKILKKKFKKIILSTKVEQIKTNEKNLHLLLSSNGSNYTIQANKVLVSIGRTPNTKNLNLENTDVIVNDKGFISTDKTMRTNVHNIYAIGDIVGDPMLAHKATFEGKVAAETIAGLPAENSPKAIPAVIFTDPEIAWAGLTETEAKSKNIPYEKGEFPWTASGKAISHDRTEGKTKTLYDPLSKQILGIGIVGTNAGDMIAEGALAIEMCADVEDISLTIHPHPTLSESIANSAEIFNGSITDLYIPKK